MRKETLMEKVLLGKQINEAFDLAVIGGGLAGTMAAISAAREGKRVILIEKYGCLGGMATAGLVYPFMRDYEGGSKKKVNAGLYARMLEELFALGGSTASDDRFYKDEIMKIVLDRMVKQAGVKVLFHAKLCEVDFADGTVRSICVTTVSGKIRIRAKIFLDCTGNADLVAQSGLPFEQGRDEDGLCQPMTLCFRLANFDWERLDKKQMNAAWAKLKEEGKIKNPREDILIVRSPIGGMVHINATRAIGVDPTDVEAVSDAEMLLREQMLELCLFFRENVPGGEHCEIASSAVESGIRESRRIVGLVRVTAEDLLSTRKFEDSIARGAYKIDIHNPAGTGTYLKSIPNNDYYTIPYRALIPQNTKNLIVAGRSVSSTHEALAAIRIMPITSCMGEAAGIAASLAIDSACALSEIDVKTLQKKLTENGALY